MSSWQFDQIGSRQCPYPIDGILGKLWMSGWCDPDKHIDSQIKVRHDGAKARKQYQK